jgi:class 3 adenylate cyclase
MPERASLFATRCWRWFCQPGFRLKLVLGILLLLGVMSFTTLLLVRKVVGGAYTEYLGNQFEREVARFQERESLLLAPVLREIGGAMHSIRLLAALDAGVWSTYFSDLEFELRQIMAAGMEDSGLPVLAFVTADGGLAMGPASATPPLDAVAADGFAQVIVSVAGSVALDAVQVGYFNVPTAAAGERFFRAVVAPFYDDYSARYFGNLVVAFPLLTASEAQAGFGGGLRVRSSLLVGDALLAGLIPQQFEERLCKARDAFLQDGVEYLDLVDNGQRMRAFVRQLPSLPGFPPTFSISLLSLAEFDQLLDQVQNLLLLVGSSAMLLAVLFSLAFVHSLTRPIGELMRGVEAVARGQFDQQLRVQSHDELGTLTQAFNEMADGLVQRERLRAVLNVVSDPAIAKALTGGDARLGGERRSVTVLFCDIRGFTRLSAQYEPERIIEWLNRHMGAMTAVVHAHGGVIDKFIGDEIMVLFGVPHSSGDDAGRAIQCARAMLVRRAELNMADDTPLQIGIGIATGDVLAGCMGSADRMNYTVIGSPVNLAARLCGAAEPGTAICCPVTRSAFRADVRVAALDGIVLKGFDSPQESYLVS